MAKETKKAAAAAQSNKESSRAKKAKALAASPKKTEPLAASAQKALPSPGAKKAAAPSGARKAKSSPASARKATAPSGTAKAKVAAARPKKATVPRLTTKKAGGTIAETSDGLARAELAGAITPPPGSPPIRGGYDPPAPHVPTGPVKVSAIRIGSTSITKSGKMTLLGITVQFALGDDGAAFVRSLASGEGFELPEGGEVEGLRGTNWVPVVHGMQISRGPKSISIAAWKAIRLCPLGWDRAIRCRGQQTKRLHLADKGLRAQKPWL